MSSRELPPSDFVQLSHNGVFVPRAAAEQNAKYVYNDIAHNVGISGALIHLSYLLDNHCSEKDLLEVFDPITRHNLLQRCYALEPLKSRVVGRLAKTAMAHNMIELVVDGDNLSGWIREPFPDAPMLESLYAHYEEVIEQTA